MYLLAPFILENFKKILRADPELWGYAIFGPKMAHLSWSKKFWNKPLLLLSSISGPFHCAKFKKILRVDPKLWGCTIFGPKMVHLPKRTLLFGKLLISLSSTYWPFSLRKIFLKNYCCESRVMRMHHFWAQNGLFPPKKNFILKQLLISFSSNY